MLELTSDKNYNPSMQPSMQYDSGEEEGNLRPGQNCQSSAVQTGPRRLYTVLNCTALPCAHLELYSPTKFSIALFVIFYLVRPYVSISL